MDGWMDGWIGSNLVDVVIWVSSTRMGCAHDTADFFYASGRKRRTECLENNDILVRVLCNDIDTNFLSAQSSSSIEMSTMTTSERMNE